MADINSYAIQSGRILGEDGQVYNLVTLLKNIGGGGGMNFLFGTSAPDATTGAPNDVYLNTNNGDFYKNLNGTWTKIGNLRGPQGPQGEQGLQGPPGADGVSVEDITSDGTNITFHLSDGSTKVIPWPTT